MVSVIDEPRFAFRAEGDDASVVIDVVTGYTVTLCFGDEHVERCRKIAAAMNGED